MYFVYMLRCGDGSVYTGITTDLLRRFKEHRNGKGARYTKNRKVIRIEAAWGCDERSDALKLEAKIKKLPKYKKEQLITDENAMRSYLDGKVDINKYHRQRSWAEWP